MADKHIEAAAAAFEDVITGTDIWSVLPVNRAALQAAITAYHDSLAAEGDEGVVEAMLATFVEEGSPIPEWHEGMRAALAVARGADAGRVAEVDRDAARYRTLRSDPWLAMETRNYEVVAMEPEDVDFFVDAARAAEGGDHE